MSHHEFVAKWAAGEILTSTSPADRRALQKVLEDYAVLKKENEELKAAANQNAFLLDKCREDRDKYAAKCFGK